MKNIGKRIMSMLCALTVLLSMVAVITPQAQAASEGLELSKMQIVVPVNSTSVESTAAAELQSYVYKITGIWVAIKTEGQQSGACVYVGATDYAARNNIAYPTQGDEKGEAWAIKAVSGSLVLCGAPERGVLYAVYHLLEDVLGVHWWNYWEETVPTGKAVVPADYCDSGVPAMEFRSIFTGVKGNEEYLYCVRNRMNANMAAIPDSYGGGEVYGAPAHVHTFTLNRYFKDSELSTHPEWFSLGTDGKRNTDQLCLTNDSLKTEFAARLISNVEADPDAIYSVSPNDNTNFCQCTSCKNAVSTYGTSGYVLRFVNEMAAAVTAAGYTDAIVEMLVYWAYIEAPKGDVIPAASVSIRFADNYIDLLHSLDHTNNANTVRNLQSWIDIGQNDIYYWQYVINYNNNGILPTMFHYGNDFVKLEAMGVNGWFAEQEQCINTDFWDMKQWLIAKLMENPVSGDAYTELMDEFIYGYYGAEAGKHIRDYLYYMNAKADATDTYVDFRAHIIGAEWLSVQDILKGNDYFEKAVAAAGNDTVLQRRLRAARSGLDRVIHENFVKWEEQAENAGLALPFTMREVGERIYQTMTEQIALRGAYDPDYPKFYDTYDNKYGEDQAPIPDALSGVTREHLLDYNTENFRIATKSHTIVSDSEALTGKAVCSDTNGQYSSGIKIVAYDPGGPSADKNDLLTIHTVSVSALEVNAGYQLYAFTWTVPELGNDPNSYIYLFDDWGLQIPSMKVDMNNLEGKTVNVFLSIKAVGTKITTYFKGQYYIESIIIDVAPSQPSHNYVTLPSTYGDTCRSVCSACGDVIRSEHQWDDGVITVEPTTEAEGEKRFVCSVCGGIKTEVLEKLPENTPAKKWGLILDGSITMQFQLRLTEAQLNTALVSYTVDGTSKRVRAATLPVDGEGLPVLMVERTAAQMTDPVDITLSAGGQQLKKSYTVKEYADCILDPASGYGDSIKQLVREMLNYGAASQAYFEYNTEDLANAGITVTPAAVPATGGDVTVTGGVDGVGFYGASLLHQNKIGVRFYFAAASTQDIVFRVNGEEQAPISKDGRFYVELPNINPQDMDEDITVSVVSGGKEMTVSYAPLDYIIRMYNKSDTSEKGKNLVQALYGYYLVAETYDL